MSQYVLNPPVQNKFYTGAQNSNRMYVRPNVYLPNSEVDTETGMLVDSRRRVGRTQALRTEASRLDAEYAKLQSFLQARASEKGKYVSLKSTIVLIATIFVVLSIILLIQHGNFVAKQNTVSLLNTKIKATQSEINDLNAQISEASDPVQVCYTAARELDMIPAESAQAIYLTAFSTRPGQEPIAIRAGND